VRHFRFGSRPERRCRSRSVGKLRSSVQLGSELWYGEFEFRELKRQLERNVWQHVQQQFEWDLEYEFERDLEWQFERDLEWQFERGLERQFERQVEWYVRW
jgi:hypothetical protein